MTAGLSEQLALMRHDELGDNALAKKEGKPWYCILIGEMIGPFPMLLWIGSFLCYIGFGL